jgi:hypothetical protein
VQQADQQRAQSDAVVRRRWARVDVVVHRLAGQNANRREVEPPPIGDLRRVASSNARGGGRLRRHERGARGVVVRRLSRRVHDVGALRRSAHSRDADASRLRRDARDEDALRRSRRSSQRRLSPPPLDARQALDQRAEEVMAHLQPRDEAHRCAAGEVRCRRGVGNADRRTSPRNEAELGEGRRRLPTVRSGTKDAPRELEEEPYDARAARGLGARRRDGSGCADHVDLAAGSPG